MTGEEREQVLALSRDAAQRGWWETSSDILPEEYTTFIGLEAEAASALTWQPVVVPGLLQTAEYSRAVTAPWQPIAALPPDEIEERTRTRLARQAVLTGDGPLAFTAVIDESVLYRRFGDESVMKSQLTHIVELAQLPNVTVHILALDGQHPIGVGAFVLLKFPRADQLGVIYPDVVCVESLISSFYEEEAAHTYRYQAVFERLTAAALSPELSIDLISKAAIDIWQ